MKKVYYEPHVLEFELGQQLQSQFSNLEWIPIDNHNNIESLRARPNEDFATMKNYLIIGTRKTHKYTVNEKVSDFLVPWTSSGCSAMCLYCYLVCNYNKCSYLRLFVNREEMMRRLCRHALKHQDAVYEIGSNSDLVLENAITNNLPWTITTFLQQPHGSLTFPTKFSNIDCLLDLNHKNRVFPRMSVNPTFIIEKYELKTSPLLARIEAVNKLTEVGYPCHLLIAPVIFTDTWQEMYEELLTILAERLSDNSKRTLIFEIIFMTYSYVHKQINTDAFGVDLYDQNKMRGRGYGKYAYKNEFRTDGEQFFRKRIENLFGSNRILYIC